MKKWTAFLLILAFCMAFIACGQADTTTGADSAAASEPEENIEQQEEQEAEPTVYHFGDTVSVSDGMFEFTPVFEGFAEKLANWPDKNYMTPNGKFSGNTPYYASEEKVMMYFSGTINYVGSSKKNESFGYNFTVDYDNGYLFDFANGDAWNRGKGYHSGGGIIDDLATGEWDYECSATFEPLSSNKTRYVRFCIEVPNQLQTNSEKVMITFHLNGEDFLFALV